MPSVDIPSSPVTVSVAVIDTGAMVKGWPCADWFDPPFPGLKTFDFCSYSFLVMHTEGGKARKLIFDLGLRKDTENWVPLVRDFIANARPEISIHRDVADVLAENGVDVAGIEAIIWSHFHFDHTGNPATFPPDVKLVVGPGSKEAHLPGYPANKKSHVNETDVAGREIVEISRDQFELTIGGMGAHDYFGDGSFYILDAPGHMIGHINALARTSVNPDSFILMAGDSIHMCGEFRPSDSVPLPPSVDCVPRLAPCPCPREVLVKMHPQKSTTKPFLRLVHAQDVDASDRTIACLGRFDGDERVLVLTAHDVDLYDRLDYFPKLANDWREKDWKRVGKWAFLADLQRISMGVKATS